MTNLALALEQSQMRCPGMFTGLNVHFIGIGGVGMKRLGSILQGLGASVTGSDLDKDRCEQLRESGYMVYHGHRPGNIPWDTSVVVYSSAVPDTNPELAEARKRGLQVVRRGKALADLSRLFLSAVVCGSHGKTTTTALTFAGLQSAGLDVLLYLGGALAGEVLPEQVGREDCFVVEADESDRSFLDIMASFPIATNIDHEHMSAYESFEDLIECFKRFLNNKPFYGAAVICADDPVLRGVLTEIDGQVITYGFHEQARVRAQSIKQLRGRTEFEVWIDEEYVTKAVLPLPGLHQVQNSLVAFALAFHLGLDCKLVAQGLERFRGVARRCEVLGRSAELMVVSDYGHHPVEILTTVQGLESHYGGNVHLIFQPHRYSRTAHCWKEFVQVFRELGSVAVLDVYPAGEAAMEKVSAIELVDAVGCPACRYLASEQELDAYVAELKAAGKVSPGDMLVFMGAGSIDSIGRKFVGD